MTVVVDTSALLPALIDDGPAGRVARSILSVPDVIAPALIDVEVLHVLRRRVRSGGIKLETAGRAIADLRRMPLERFDMVPLIERVWQLRDNLTAYDATFVALAETFDAQLVTADDRLANSPGPRCRFNVIAPA